MRLYFLLLSIFLTSSTIGLSQPPAIIWEKSYGGTQSDGSYDMVASKNGKIAICGTSNSVNYDLVCNTDSLNADYWIYCIDSSGTLLWSKCYGGTYYDAAFAIDTTIDHGFIVAGVTSSTDGDVIGNHSEGQDYWVIKLDSLGNLEWSKCYGGIQADWAYDIKTTSDGGFIVAGEGRSNDGDVTGHHGSEFVEDCWIIKLDFFGNIEWEKSLGGSSVDYGLSIIEYSKKKYLTGGYAQSNDGDIGLPIGSGDFWIVMLDSAGAIIWEHSYGGSKSDQCRIVLRTYDGNILCYGPSDSDDFQVTDNYGLTDYLVIAIDSNGTFLWSRSYGGAGSDLARGIVLTPDSGFTAIGLSQNSAGTGLVSANYGVNDYWIVKADKKGNFQWERNFGGTREDIGNTCLVLNSNIYLSGFSASSDNDVSFNHSSDGFLSDSWVLKLDGYTAIKEIISNALTLHLYPNPVHDVLLFTPDARYKNKYNLVTIYDLTGKLIRSERIDVIDQPKPINISDIQSGLYVLSITLKDGSIVSQLFQIVHP